MRARRTTLHLVSLAGLALALGCAEERSVSPSGPGRGVPVRGAPGAPPIEAPAAPPLPSPSSRPAAPGRTPRVSRRTELPPGSARGVPGGPGEPSAPAADEPRAPSPPDLGEALRTAFGTPTDCVSRATRERLTSRLRVSVTVIVTAEGRVTRASVSSPQLAPPDLECMRTRAENLRLPGPVPNAPRSVSTSAEYEVRAGPAEAADRAPATPESERPPGFVPPSSTLPAQAP